MCNTIKGKEGVEEVVSITRAFNIHKDTVQGKFDFNQIAPVKLSTQAEVDSVRNLIFSLPLTFLST